MCDVFLAWIRICPGDDPKEVSPFMCRTYVCDKVWPNVRLIAQQHKKIAQVGSKLCHILYEPHKKCHILPKRRNVAKSGHTAWLCLIDLVTLPGSSSKWQISQERQSIRSVYSNILTHCRALSDMLIKVLFNDTLANVKGSNYLLIGDRVELQT